MKNTILKTLRQIELERNIVILYAVESGSRLWGFHNENSDYDVRFIYLNNHRHYLSLNICNKRDVITFGIANDHTADTKLDIVGWDLKKVLNYYLAGKTQINEWVTAPQSAVYIEPDKTIHQLQQLINHQIVETKQAQHHYYWMAVGQKEYTDKHPENIKKLLYVLRPLMCCLYVGHFKAMPPTNFFELTDRSMISAQAKIFIKRLAQNGGEEMTEHEIKTLRYIINEFFDSLNPDKFEKAPLWPRENLSETLNKLFVEAVNDFQVKRIHRNFVSTNYE